MEIIDHNNGYIHSTEDLVHILREREGNPSMLFRGQGVDKDLLPKIARGRNLAPAALENLEREMLERFRKESIPFLSNLLPQTDWDWLSIAQHQGLPTRLLDWTKNALAGLWFAVSTDPPKETEFGVLWILDVLPDDLKSPSKKQDIFDLRRTYIFQPFHIDRRIAAQSAWFSVHKYHDASESFEAFVPLNWNKQYIYRLKKYKIPCEDFPKIRRELRLMGVTQATMFPDLSGLCAEIQSAILGEHPDVESI
jgi:hypothetical protein